MDFEADAIRTVMESDEAVKASLDDDEELFAVKKRAGDSLTKEQKMLPLVERRRIARRKYVVTKELLFHRLKNGTSCINEHGAEERVKTLFTPDTFKKSHARWVHHRRMAAGVKAYRTRWQRTVDALKAAGKEIPPALASVPLTPQQKDARRYQKRFKKAEAKREKERAEAELVAQKAAIDAAAENALSIMELWD